MNSKGHNINAAYCEAELSWAGAIADAGDVAQLRTSPVKEPGNTPVTSSLRLEVPRETIVELERVCRSAPFLSWTALIAGAALYLSRYARTESVAIAAPPRKDLPGGTPGAIFPVLLYVDANRTFREFLQSCRTQLSALYTKAPAGAKELLAAGLSAPNFQCPFQIGIGYAGLHGSLPDNAADIRIDFEQQEGGIYANAVFNNCLFTTQAVSDILTGQFELLRQGLGQPERRLSELSLISLDRAHELYASSKPEDGAVAVEDFVALFQRIAARQPDAIAIRENEIAVSYRELDRRADDVARVLVSRGIRNEDIVGVAMNRNATAIAAILGIWKAGAAYLPCDPGLPAKRLSQVLQDSGARLVLTDRDLALPRGCAATIVHTAQLSAAAGPALPKKPSPANPGRLAYVIYTSGSTGQPKGVLLSHRGLASLVRAQREIFSDEECRSVLQFSSHSFDASIFDITMALGHGGALHMSGDLQIPTGEQLFAVLHDQQITLATIPPCVVATLPEGELPGLKVLVVAGEACPQALADQWSKRVRFVNAYGPTETTVWATFEHCRPDSQITIGAAIPGCRAHVLDQYLQPLPPGCPGELCLSGENLARGFVGLPATTAQRFVPNPLASEPGERLYRTGDLVVLGQDGRIEFLGRGDHQHKIRGYRIELGDIEAALCAHPQVEQATAIVKDGPGDSPGDSKTIVAYAVARLGCQVTSSALREFVSERLPEYMVPAQMAMVDKMPLTRSGKVDRRALLQLENAAPPAGTSGQEKPATPIEETLAVMWAELLKRDQVGPEENFFQLGGHSLLAIQVVSRIKKLFGVHLPARMVFDAPTVRALARRVEDRRQLPQPENGLATEPTECACPVVVA